MKDFIKEISLWDLLILAIITGFWVLDRPNYFPLFLLLPLMWLSWYLQRGNIFPVKPLNLPFLLLSLWTLFSLAITPDLANSAGKVLGIVLGISIYLFVLRLSVSSRRSMQKSNDFDPDQTVLVWIITGYVFVGAGIALMGLFSADWFDKYPMLAHLSGLLPNLIPTLPGAPVGLHPNAISGTLTLFTPVTVLLAWQVWKSGDAGWIKNLNPFPTRLVKICLFLILIAHSMWWLLAQSRGAWLGLSAGILFLILNIFKPDWRRFSWIFPIIPVVLVYILWFQSEGINPGLIDLETIGGAFLTNTLATRFQIWGWAVKVLQDFPFTGLGFNMFREIAPILYFGPRNIDVAHAHNIWLDVGVSLGYGGIVIYLALWIVNIYSLWNIWKKRNEHWIGQIAMALLAGWYAYFVFGIADTIPLGSKLGLMIFFALALGQILSSDLE